MRYVKMGMTTLTRAITSTINKKKCGWEPPLSHVSKESSQQAPNTNPRHKYPT